MKNYHIPLYSTIFFRERCVSEIYGKRWKQNKQYNMSAKYIEKYGNETKNTKSKTCFSVWFSVGCPRYQLLIGVKFIIVSNLELNGNLNGGVNHLLSPNSKNKWCYRESCAIFLVNTSRPAFIRNSGSLISLKAVHSDGLSAVFCVGGDSFETIYRGGSNFSTDASIVFGPLKFYKPH